MTQNLQTAPVLTLEACLHRGPDVGGKATGLAALIDHGLPVPPGFCVTTAAYRDAVLAGGIRGEIKRLVGAADFRSDNTAASAAVAEVFSTLVLPEAIAGAITAEYERLGGDAAHVAVRSSATAEDLADASFAGQQDTYLHVRGAPSVLEHVIKCWASLFTPQAIGYRSRFDVDVEDLAMAVVVQKMVPAASAGVMMTLHPVTGDRSRIFIEAAYGLGEGVVRGDVGVDRFEVDKATLDLVDRAVEPKDQAHHFVEADGEVRLVDVPDADREKPCLSEEEVAGVAALGRRIEEAFGKPMDVEWAVAEADDGAPREILLLQARPETVWSRREEEVPAEATSDPQSIDPFEDWDPLHTWSDPDTNWTTTNIGEAMPGVMTPLGWTLWQCAEGVFRGVIADIGALTDEERRAPARPHDWIMRAFYGRIAWSVDFFGTVGDRMPGTSAADAARSLLGRVPDGFPSNPTRARYPAVARKMPGVVRSAPTEAREVAAETAAWYRRTIQVIPTMDLAAARRTVDEASEHFARILTAQGHVTFAVIQPLYDALEKLVARVGVGDAGILSGSGGAETAGMLTDMWAASRDQLSMEELLLRHGYHGPEEGEVSSRPWREDPTPLAKMLQTYATQDESQSPAARDAVAKAKARAMAAELLAAVPAYQRPAVKRLIGLAERQVPLRGVAKRGMLQSVDTCRAAARRVGHLLGEQGVLDDPEDVFFLTVTELSGTLPDDVTALVARRRERRTVYQQLTIGGDWKGMPVPVDVADRNAANARETAGVSAVTGIGVSRGVFEGRARIVDRADFAEVRHGEVLVAPTTDPSWASIMFVSAALVVDIGGALSHAAVVARELGLPCVVNTRVGTSAIRTGDLVRVDGGAGTVDILERADAPDDARTAPEPEVG